jgi:hypothetical protein
MLSYSEAKAFLVVLATGLSEVHKNTSQDIVSAAKLPYLYSANIFDNPNSLFWFGGDNDDHNRKYVINYLQSVVDALKMQDELVIQVVALQKSEYLHKQTETKLAELEKQVNKGKE